jgi:restriction endonuclease S subunit
MRVDSIAPIEPSSAGYTACEFKDSPLGQIPQEWDVKTIAETAAPITNSFTDGDWIEAPHIRQQGIRLVQTGNIGVGEFLDKAEDRKFISQESFAALGCKPLQTGDVLICRLADPVGRACVVPDYIGDAITAVDVTIYRPNPKLLRSRFAMWQMNSLSALNRCDVLAGGTTRKRISRLNLGRLPLAVPKIEEQITIEVVLDTVDEAIAKTEAVIAKLKQVRAGLLHDLLTRGLDENGQLRDPIAYPEQFQGSPLGLIPRVWSIETLGERLKQNSGTIQTGPFGSQLHAHEYRAEGIPVIMPQDIRGADFDDTQIARIPVTKAEELRRHRVRRGDLIFARRGDLSRCVAVGEREVEWLCGTGCLLMRFEQLNLSPRWLSLAYRHDFGQRQIAARAVGTTMVNLNTTLLAHLVFAFPRKQEQEDIVRRIDEADATIQKELANVLKLGLLKSGLMNDLLAGRVRVPEGIAVTG